MILIVDASVTIAWIVEDEAERIRGRRFGALETDHAIVPAIWHWEISNAHWFSNGKVVSQMRYRRIRTSFGFRSMSSDQRTRTTAWPFLNSNSRASID